MKTENIFRIIFVTIVMMILSACGGGSDGGSDNTSTTTSSNKFYLLHSTSPSSDVSDVMILNNDIIGINESGDSAIIHTAEGSMYEAKFRNGNIYYFGIDGYSIYYDTNQEITNIYDPKGSLLYETKTQQTPTKSKSIKSKLHVDNLHMATDFGCMQSSEALDACIQDFRSNILGILATPWWYPGVFGVAELDTVLKEKIDSFLKFFGIYKARVENIDLYEESDDGQFVIEIDEDINWDEVDTSGHATTYYFDPTTTTASYTERNYFDTRPIQTITYEPDPVNSDTTTTNTGTSDTSTDDLLGVWSFDGLSSGKVTISFESNGRGEYIVNVPGYQVETQGYAWKRSGTQLEFKYDSTGQWGTPSTILSLTNTKLSLRNPDNTTGYYTKVSSTSSGTTDSSGSGSSTSSTDSNNLNRLCTRETSTYVYYECNVNSGSCTSGYTNNGIYETQNACIDAGERWFDLFR